MKNLSLPSANVRNPDGSLRVSIRIAVDLRAEMDRFGITAARLRRHARTLGVTGVRVDEALRGEAGWLKAWTSGAVRDWVDMIRGAWLTE